MMNRVHKWAKLASAVSLAAVASGCGIADGALRKPNAGEDGKGGSLGQSGDAVANGSVVDLVMFPPKEYYDYLLASAFDLVDRDQVVNQFAVPQSLWLNFDGGTVQRGYLPGQSYLVCSTAAVMPPLGISAPERDEIVKKVQEKFASIGTNVAVSASKPTVGEPTVIHVGGSYVDLGCPEGKGRQGIAPFDPANANRSDVGFVFASAATSTGALAQTIVHVAGHAFGLDHVTNNQDVMYAWATNGSSSFAVSPLAGGSAIQDGPAVLRQILTMPWGGSGGVGSGQGPSFPQAPLYLPGVGYVAAGFPSVPGFTQLVNASQLTNALGASQVLDLTALTPRLRSVFGQSLSQTGLAGFDRVATVFALATRAAVGQQGGKALADATDEGNDELDDQFDIGSTATGGKPPSGSGTPSPPSGLFIDGPLVGQYLGAQGGGQVSLDRLATAAGFQTVDSAIKAIQAGLAAGTLKLPSDTEFADLASVLSLSTSVTSTPALFNGFWASTYYVKGSLTGLNQSGMNAALKIAYYQHYLRLAAASGR